MPYHDSQSPNWVDVVVTLRRQKLPRFTNENLTAGIPTALLSRIERYNQIHLYTSLAPPPIEEPVSDLWRNYQPTQNPWDNPF